MSLRFCPRCRLAYRPDGRIHVEPDRYCPQCGYDLSKAERKDQPS